MFVLCVGVALILGAAAISPEQCGQGVENIDVSTMLQVSANAYAQAEKEGSAKSECHLKATNTGKCLTPVALNSDVEMHQCGAAQSQQGFEWITVLSALSIRLKDTNHCLELGPGERVKLTSCNSQAAQSFVQRSDGTIKLAGADKCLMGIGSTGTTRVFAVACYMADYDMGTDYQILHSDCTMPTIASYAACLKPYGWNRQSDVAISVAGAEDCAGQCKLAGSDFFGMECPMGDRAHCQCISGSGAGTNLGKDGGSWVLGTEYCAGIGNPLVHSHGHCTGAYQVDGYLFGDYGVGSMYDVHTQLPNSFNDLGSGYCNTGYYAGWVAADAVDLETCQAKCLTESNCKFISLKLESSCSRYSSSAGSCSNRASGHSDHHSYARQ